MPKKPNSHGNDQEYVPAGNGDASGEYADEGGSNKGFSNFKKPERDTQQLPKSTERRVYERDMKEETDPNIKTYMGEDGSKKIIKKIGENKYRIEHWERYENNGDPFWEKPFDDPDVYSKDAIQQYYGRDYVPGAEDKKIPTETPKIKTAIDKYIKSKIFGDDKPNRVFNLDDGQYIENGASVIRLNNPVGVDAETLTQDNEGFANNLKKHISDIKTKKGDAIKMPSIKEMNVEFKNNPESKRFYKLADDYFVNGTMLKNIIDALGGEIDEAYRQQPDTSFGRTLEMANRIAPLYLKSKHGEAFILPKRKVD